MRINLFIVSYSPFGPGQNGRTPLCLAIRREGWLRWYNDTCLGVPGGNMGPTCQLVTTKSNWPDFSNALISTVRRDLGQKVAEEVKKAIIIKGKKSLAMGSGPRGLYFGVFVNDVFADASCSVPYGTLDAVTAEDLQRFSEVRKISYWQLPKIKLENLSGAGGMTELTKLLQGKGVPQISMEPDILAAEHIGPAIEILRSFTQKEEQMTKRRYEPRARGYAEK